jgi:hypothetical protein
MKILVFLILTENVISQVLNIDREIDCFLKKKYLFAFLTKTKLSINGLTALEKNDFFQIRFRNNDARFNINKH